MSEVSAADLLVCGGPVHTGDPARPWTEAMAVRGGRVVAVGTLDDLVAFRGPRTEVLDTGGRLTMPGLVDGHVHLGLGGRQVAWELALDPRDGVERVLDTVAAAAAGRADDEWVVGGIVSGSILYAVAEDAAWLGRLDAAAGGRPVLLRDDSMHNRWVSSRALALMGVGADTPDPAGGRYVRDGRGDLTGVLFEVTSAVAESAHDATVADPATRDLESLRAAVATMNANGFTAMQDAATMAYAVDALARLDELGELNAWVVASTPTRPFIEAGTVGVELHERAAGRRTPHLRPDFVKIVLDGVAQTRTSAMLAPYAKHSCDEPDVFGEPYWTREELLDQLAYCHAHGLGAKVHATGDRSAQLVLDVVEEAQRRWGAGPRVQVAHAKILDPKDLPRFGALGVDVDAAPYVWVESSITAALRSAIGDERVDRSWPIRDLVESGATVAAGSDWPCVVPRPDPWGGLETMVTRTNTDPAWTTPLNPAQAVDVATAVRAFTSAPAASMGMGHVTGMLRPGLSADFIVVDRNVFTVDPAQIHATRVDLTYFEGRVVFRRAAEPTPTERI